MDGWETNCHYASGLRRPEADVLLICAFGVTYTTLLAGSATAPVGGPAFPPGAGASRTTVPPERMSITSSTTAPMNRNLRRRGHSVFGRQGSRAAGISHHTSIHPGAHQVSQEKATEACRRLLEPHHDQLSMLESAAAHDSQKMNHTPS